MTVSGRVSVLNRCLKEICISFESPLTHVKPANVCPLQSLTNGVSLGQLRGQLLLNADETFILRSQLHQPLPKTRSNFRSTLTHPFNDVLKGAGGVLQQLIEQLGGILADGGIDSGPQ